MGVRLPSLLRSVGLEPQPPYEATALAYGGIAAVEAAAVPAVRSMLGVLTEHGIASEPEIGIDSFAERLRLECGDDPVLLLGMFLAVWARKP